MLYLKHHANHQACTYQHVCSQILHVIHSTNNIPNWTFQPQIPEKQHVQYNLQTSSNKINSRKILHVIHLTNNIPNWTFWSQNPEKQHVRYRLQTSINKIMLFIQPITYQTRLLGLKIQKNSKYNTTSKPAVTRSIPEKLYMLFIQPITYQLDFSVSKSRKTACTIQPPNQQ